MYQAGGYDDDMPLPEFECYDWYYFDTPTPDYSPIEQGGGGGSVNHSDVPGFDCAWGKLSTDCAQAIGGSKVSAVDVRNRLMNVTYTQTAMSAATSSGYRVAYTDGSTTVLNSDVFFHPESLLSRFAEVFGLNPSRFDSIDFQAIYLLHELGHTMGWKDDTPAPGAAFEDSANYRNTKTVIDNCFKDKKK